MCVVLTAYEPWLAAFCGACHGNDKRSSYHRDCRHARNGALTGWTERLDEERSFYSNAGGCCATPAHSPASPHREGALPRALPDSPHREGALPRALPDSPRVISAPRRAP